MENIMKCHVCGKDVKVNKISNKPSLVFCDDCEENSYIDDQILIDQAEEDISWFDGIDVTWTV